ncbi:SDR family oxidoreductase [Candidatus Pelagibacter sp.]|nr:SDR family oxidoreductase [Candidatus Pelagibacter sp.]MDC1482679.1 SDR family oxidoreductase [Pelagibacteraceae bacterium]
MSNRLEGKDIIVTAAGQGIGKATAVAFHNEGAHVTATDLNDKTLAELNKEYPKIKVQTLDSTDNNAILKFMKSVDRVDILFNAVGFVHHGTILDCKENDWDFSFDVNVKSMYQMCKAILPLMVKQNGGSIINVSSCASSLKGFPNRFVYGTTKGAVIGLTKSIAADFVKQNIRCNSIAPGTVFSPSWQDRVNQSPDPVQAKKDFIARQPMGRLGTAEEIAAVAVYLAGDDATFTTGTTISVDGGISI